MQRIHLHRIDLRHPARSELIGNTAGPGEKVEYPYCRKVVLIVQDIEQPFFCEIRRRRALNPAGGIT